MIRGLNSEYIKQPPKHHGPTLCLYYTLNTVLMDGQKQLLLSDNWLCSNFDQSYNMQNQQSWRNMVFEHFNFFFFLYKQNREMKIDRSISLNLSWINSNRNKFNIINSSFTYTSKTKYYKMYQQNFTKGWHNIYIPQTTDYTVTSDEKCLSSNMTCEIDLWNANTRILLILLINISSQTI